MDGVISKFFSWFAHPSYADSDPTDWFAFLVLIILASLLWSRVVKQTIESV